MLRPSRQFKGIMFDVLAVPVSAGKIHITLNSKNQISFFSIDFILYNDTWQRFCSLSDCHLIDMGLLLI